MRKLLILLFLVAPLCAQNLRYSTDIPSISSSTTTPFLVANVPPNSLTLSVCHSPANATPCTNYATTYTSTGTACANGAQDTPDPQPSACQSTSDARGNIGFWAPSGQYDYTVCVQNTTTCYGPFTITLGAASGGSGITGSGSTGQLAVFTGSTAIGSSEINASASEIAFGNPSNLTGAIGFIENNAYSGSGSSCANSVSVPISLASCQGYEILDEPAPSSNLGYMAGLSVVAENTLHNTTKIIGIYANAESGTSGTTTDEYGGYIFAEENLVSTVTNRHGLYVLAYNDTPNTSTLNEGVVAQTGGNGGGTSTTDYSVHVLAPANGETLTTHAGIEVDAQATGVPLQLKPVGFATLPACSATYEGSQAAVSDANIGTWGSTITAGSSTNHVLAYCDGTNWTVAGK